MVEIRCNKCGKVLDTWDKMSRYSIHRGIGYGSAYDGQMLELDMCCECMDELIKSCAILPVVEWPDEDDEYEEE